MGILRQKRFKAGLGLAVVALAVVIAVVIAGNSTVVAKGFGGYDQVSSAEDLKQARGVVDALAQINGGGERLISGEWTLKCRGRCANAKLQNIEFDISFAMRKTDGGGRHSHQFSGFSATEVTLEDDDLTIKGEITGTNEIAEEDVTIRLVAIADGNASFYFKLNKGNSIVSEMGGAIVESK